MSEGPIQTFSIVDLQSTVGSDDSEKEGRYDSELKFTANLEPILPQHDAVNTTGINYLEKLPIELIQQIFDGVIEIPSTSRCTRYCLISKKLSQVTQLLLMRNVVITDSNLRPFLDLMNTRSEKRGLVKAIKITLNTPMSLYLTRELLEGLYNLRQLGLVLKYWDLHSFKIPTLKRLTHLSIRCSPLYNSNPPYPHLLHFIAQPSDFVNLKFLYILGVVAIPSSEQNPSSFPNLQSLEILPQLHIWDDENDYDVMAEIPAGDTIDKVILGSVHTLTRLALKEMDFTNTEDFTRSLEILSPRLEDVYLITMFTTNLPNFPKLRRLDYAYISFTGEITSLLNVFPHFYSFSKLKYFRTQRVHLQSPSVDGPATFALKHYVLMEDKTDVINFKHVVKSSKNSLEILEIGRWDEELDAEIEGMTKLKVLNFIMLDIFPRFSTSLTKNLVCLAISTESDATDVRWYDRIPPLPNLRYFWALHCDWKKTLANIERMDPESFPSLRGVVCEDLTQCSVMKWGSEERKLLVTGKTTALAKEWDWEIGYYDPKFGQTETESRFW